MTKCKLCLHTSKYVFTWLRLFLQFRILSLVRWHGTNDLIRNTRNELIHHSQLSLFVQRGPPLGGPSTHMLWGNRECIKKDHQTGTPWEASQPTPYADTASSGWRDPREESDKRKGWRPISRICVKRSHLGSMRPSGENQLDQSIQKQIP